QAVLDAHGQISLLHASRVHSAALALRQVLRLQKLLAACETPGHTATSEKVQGGNVARIQTGLTIEQFLAISDRLVRHKEAVDRALAALNLDRSQANPLDYYDHVDSYSARQPKQEPKDGSEVIATSSEAPGPSSTQQTASNADG